MKPEIPLKSGDEYDVFSGWRKVLSWNPGQIKKIKRRYWKKVCQYWRKNKQQYECKESE